MSINLVFDQIAMDVWKQIQKLIPPEFRPQIEKIHILILDEPTPDLLKDLDEDLQEAPEELFGLYVGTPMTKASVIDPGFEPARVYLFRWALLTLIEEEISEGESQEDFLREEIAITLLHEIGHFFGLEEEDLERLGYD